ncbi:hypothetical protein TWF718_002447 [Orbilia javanica]|uniref:Uncharacterized protein n=1 Tax=Orbilia javanica TaxID=47235 RepID=A0AAN8MG05_9PEZI
MRGQKAVFIAFFLVGANPVLGMRGIEIAFVPLMDCRLLRWDFEKLEPAGCHPAVPEYQEFLDTIRLRTAYPYLEDIPDAIAIYDGPCTKANVKLVIFPYKLEFMDQEVHVLEPEWEDIEYPKAATYQVLKEGSAEWKKVLGNKPPLPTNEGDVWFRENGGWGRLPNEIWLYPVRQWRKPLKKSLDVYQKGVGVRPKPLTQPPEFENLNMRLGTLEKQFPDSPDSVLVRPRIRDDEERLPGWLSNPQTQGEWAGTDENPLVPQRMNPLRCEGQSIKYKDSLTGMSEKFDSFEKMSPGFRLFRNNRARSPLQIPSGNTSSGKLHVPNPRLPRVQVPSAFSPSHSRSQSPDDFGWDVLRPQRVHRVQDRTPNYLGEDLRRSAERDESVSEIPNELSPGEKIRVDMKETDFEPILGGITLSPWPSDSQPMDSFSPILPLQRESEGPSAYPDESSDPRINAIILNSNPDLDSQYFF